MVIMFTHTQELLKLEAPVGHLVFARGSPQLRLNASFCLIFTHVHSAFMTYDSNLPPICTCTGLVWSCREFGENSTPAYKIRVNARTSIITCYNTF